MTAPLGQEQGRLGVCKNAFTGGGTWYDAKRDLVRRPYDATELS